MIKVKEKSGWKVDNNYEFYEMCDEFLKVGLIFVLLSLNAKLVNAGIDQIIGKMEVPGDYNSYLQPDKFNMTG